MCYCRVLLTPPTNRPPTHRPNNHRPNQQDSISKTWSMKNIHFTERKQLGRCKTKLRSIIYLMNRYLCKISFIFRKSLSLVFFKRKLLFCKRHTKDLCSLFFYILNLTALPLPRYWQFISTHGSFNKTRCFSTYSNILYVS